MDLYVRLKEVHDSDTYITKEESDNMFRRALALLGSDKLSSDEKAQLGSVLSQAKAGLLYKENAYQDLLTDLEKKVSESMNEGNYDKYISRARTFYDRLPNIIPNKDQLARSAAEFWKEETNSPWSEEVYHEILKELGGEV